MTIDERLERLTGRHEPLTQTVGIIAHQIEALAGRDGENIRALARIADLRITRLEGGEQR